MRAIASACERGEIEAEVGRVGSTRADAPGLEIAQQMGLPIAVIENPRHDGGASMLLAFDGCDILCLAGFMMLVPSAVLANWPDRILNIHPALLPKFGGKGMYGLHVHAAVLAAGETESGCTVHLVNEHYDEGAILLQLRCPIMPHDTPEQLAARVLELEHQAYPMAINEVLRGIK